MAVNTSELDIVVRARDEASSIFKQTESSVIRLVGAVASLVTAFQTVAFPLREATALQTELINVAKTTDFTNDQISALRIGLVQLSGQLDITTTDLAKIAATAGQLGLGSAGVEGIKIFTETAARFASVVGISVEESANGLARLRNIFNINVAEVERISSLLNEISNNSTASGKDLIDVVQRIGTAGTVLGIQEAAALGALGRDLGLSLEVVGTSFQKVFLSLQTDAAKIAPALGLPVREFVNLLKTDGIGAIKLYSAALAKMDAQSRAAFIEQSSGGGRIFNLVTNLANDAANNFELLDKHLLSAKIGYEGGTSAIKEQERVMQGLEKQLQLVKNGFTNLAIALGTQAVPFLTDLAQKVALVLKDPKTLDNVLQFGKGIGQVVDAVQGFISAIEGVLSRLYTLLPLLELLAVGKVVNTFAGMAAGLYRSAANAALAVKQFTELANGTTAVRIATDQSVLAAEKEATVRQAAAAQAVKNNEIQIVQLARRAEAEEAATAVAVARSKVLANLTSAVPQNLLVPGAALGVGPAAKKIADFEAQAAAVAATEARKASIAAAEAAEVASIARVTQLSNVAHAADIQANQRKVALNAVLVREQAGLTAQAAERTALEYEILAIEQDLLVVAGSQIKEQKAVEKSLVGQINARKLTLEANIANNEAVAAGIALEKQRLGFLVLEAETTRALARANAQNAAAQALNAAGARRAPPLSNVLSAAEALSVGQRAAEAVPKSFLGRLGGALSSITLPTIATFTTWLGAVARGVVSFLLGPWGIGIALALTFFSDDIARLFDEITGGSGKTSAELDQDSRVRATALDEESLRVRNLSDQYKVLSATKKFTDFSADKIIDPKNFTKLKDGMVEAATQMKVILGRAQQLGVEMEKLSSSENAVGVELNSLNEKLKEQLALATKLREMSDKAPGNVGTRNDANTAQKEVERLQARIQELEAARNALRAQRSTKESEAPVLREQLGERLKVAALTYDADTQRLLDQGVALNALAQKYAKVRDEAAALNKKVEEGTASAKESTDALIKDNTATALKAQTLEGLKAIEEAIKSAAPSAKDTLQTVIPDLLNSNAQVTQALAASVASAATGNTEALEKQLAAANTKINEGYAGLKKASGAQAIELRKEIDVQKAVAFQTQVLIEATRNRTVTEEQSTAAIKANRVAALDRDIGVAARVLKLREETKALVVFRDAMEQEAKAYTKLWQQSVSDVGAVIQKGFALAASFISQAVTRQNNLRLSVFDVDTVRLKTSLDRALSLYAQAQRRKFDLQGLTPEQRDQKEYELQSQLDAAKEQQDQARKVQRVQEEYRINEETVRNAAARTTSLQAEILKEQAVLAESVRQRAKADNDSQKETYDRLIEASKNKIAVAIAESQEQIKLARDAKTKLQELAQSKVDGGQFTDTVSPINAKLAEAEITKISGALAQLGVRQTQILKEAEDRAIAASSAAGTALGAAQSKLNELMVTAKALAASMNVTVEEFLEKAGAKLRDTIAGFKEAERTAKELANVDWAGDPTKLPQLSAAFSREMADSEKIVNDGIQKMATAFDEAGLGKSENARRVLIQTYFGVEETKKGLEEAEKTLKNAALVREGLVANINVKADPTQVRTAVQDAANTGEPVEIRAKFAVTPGGAATGTRQYADGGPIYGPGTGTSDSILARLSHGEYVSDARTVSSFGSGFFSMLKSISRQGGGAVNSFLQSFGNLPLPAFAGGGYVSAGVGGSGGGASVANGSMDTVRVELAVGGQTATLFTERDQAKALSKVLKNLGRSA